MLVEKVNHARGWMKSTHVIYCSWTNQSISIAPIKDKISNRKDFYLLSTY